jgi:hypothetical protein
MRLTTPGDKALVKTLSCRRPCRCSPPGIDHSRCCEGTGPGKPYALPGERVIGECGISDSQAASGDRIVGPLRKCRPPTYMDGRVGRNTKGPPLQRLRGSGASCRQAKVSLSWCESELLSDRPIVPRRPGFRRAAPEPLERLSSLPRRRSQTNGMRRRIS